MGGTQNMFRKIPPNISSTNSDAGNPPPSSSEGKKRYVLEGVFWVPANHASARDSNSRPSPKLREDRLDKRESSKFRTSK
jgi:hypothetical protein